MATEFHWHQPGDKRFKATVEYMTSEESLVEAEYLVKNLLLVREGGNDDDDDDDDKQESEDGVDELEDKHALDTQAEIAWRKLSTVFPNLEKEELIHEHKSVDEILDTIRRRIGKIKQIGTLETIETNDEDEFGEQVSVLVADKADEEARGGLLWPLVKAFRVGRRYPPSRNHYHRSFPDRDTNPVRSI